MKCLSVSGRWSHSSIDGRGERAVHEAGFDTKCKKHERSGITAKMSMESSSQ